MRSMAIHKADRRRHLLLLAVVFTTLAGIAVQKWDSEDLARMREEAAAAPHRVAAFAVEAKHQALMYAVEESGHREYFAAEAHCRVPLKGERLEMQRASNSEPGKGYRCVYWIVQTPPGVRPAAIVTWSRTPEVELRVPYAGRPQ